MIQTTDIVVNFLNKIIWVPSFIHKFCGILLWDLWDLFGLGDWVMGFFEKF